MPYVVAEPCINCKHTDCVEVCPVDCFYEGPNFLAIHPDDEGTAYVTVSGSGTPHVYKTTDFGTTWTAASACGRTDATDMARSCWSATGC